MKNSTVLAAAFAAGLMTFAVNAQEGATQAAKLEATPISRAMKDDLVTSGETLVKTEEKSAEKAETPPRGLTAEEVHHAVKAAEKDFAVAAKTNPVERYKAIVDRYAVQNGVAVELAHAVVTVESNYKPNSRGSAGEVGLMQIKPATARLMGYKGTTTGLFDPETNIKYGMKYLGKAQKLGGGTTCGTILKYNAGHGAKRMNPISRNYCAKVKRHLATGSTAKVVLAADRGA